MDHAPADKGVSTALGQGVGYGIVLGLGGAFALGEFMQAMPPRATPQTLLTRLGPGDDR